MPFKLSFNDNIYFEKICEAIQVYYYYYYYSCLKKNKIASIDNGNNDNELLLGLAEHKQIDDQLLLFNKANDLDLSTINKAHNSNKRSSVSKSESSLHIMNQACKRLSSSLCALNEANCLEKRANNNPDEVNYSDSSSSVSSSLSSLSTKSFHKIIDNNSMPSVDAPQLNEAKREENANNAAQEQTHFVCDYDNSKANKPRPSYLFQPNCHIFGGCVDDDADDEFFISSGAVYNSWPYVYEPGFQPVPLINYVDTRLSKSITRIDCSSEPKSLRDLDPFGFENNELNNNELPSYWLDNFEINMIHTREANKERKKKKKKSVALRKKKKSDYSVSLSSSASCSLISGSCSDREDDYCYEYDEDESGESSDDSESIIEYKKRHAIGLNQNNYFKCSNLNNLNTNRGDLLAQQTESSYSSSRDSIRTNNLANNGNHNSSNVNRMTMSYYNEHDRAYKTNLNKVRFLSQKRVDRCYVVEQQRRPMQLRRNDQNHNCSSEQMVF